MFRLMLASCILLSIVSCGTTDGENVTRDIDRYAYANQPLSAARLEPDVEASEPGKFAVMPYDAMQMASRKSERVGASVASSDVPWRIPTACRANFRRWAVAQRPASPTAAAELSATFLDSHPDCPPSNALVGVAISGGGPYSAIYATEVLFELDRYGLADEIDVISSVSGGSYAAAVFGWSCDPKDPATSNCATARAGNQPVWEYRAMTDRFHSNSFFRDFGIIAAVRSPLAWGAQTYSNTSDTYARVLSRNYGIPMETAFADLNPARPNLILNATNDTRSRADFDANAHIPRADRRPISPDDSLHFSFTQQYFWRLLSDLDSYPLIDGVAASGAFPLVVDHVGLRQYRIPELIRRHGALPPAGFLPCGYPDLETTTDPTEPACASPNTVTPRPKYITLLDGGVRDNYGVTELNWLVECQFGVATPNGGFIRSSDIAAAEPYPSAKSAATFYRRHCGRYLPPKITPQSILIIGINSNTARSNGEVDDVPKPVDAVDRTLPYIKPYNTVSAVSQIMSASGEKRRQGLSDLVDVVSRSKQPDTRTYKAHSPGPFRYLDIDMEAAQLLYCDPKLWSDDILLNSLTGASHASRCQALEGVLQWHQDRNLQLPEATSDFCPNPNFCTDLDRFVGKRTSAQIRKDNNMLLSGENTGRVRLSPQTRLFNNRHLFEHVRGASILTHDPADVYALRYVARWAVAHRLWELCNGDNATVLHAMGQAKWKAVCYDRLPDRPNYDPVQGMVTDNIGGKEFRHDVLGNNSAR